MKSNKKKILLMGYGILSILAIVFLFLAIFTEDNKIYLYVGLACIIVAYILNLIRNLDSKS